MPETTPRVTVVVPMRNEASSITECLESILANRLPDGDIEVLVFDGESTDGSAEVVRALAARDPRVRLHDNPERLQAAAFNRGLALARGAHLVRMDAHTLYAPDYIAECVRLLEETGAAGVGGVQQPTGRTVIGRAIAAAVSSRFAAGDAKYRHASAAAWVDTVYLGAWRTDTVRDVGGMNAAWAVNEDYEMNIRLRAAGGRMYLSPTIRSTYFVRGSLAKLARQYFRYGFWKVRTLLAHPLSVRWRQLVAPAFVVSLLVTPLLVHLFGALGAAHLGLYAAANLAASVITAAGSSWRHLPVLPVVFFLIHLSWGSGFLLGWLYWPLHRDPAPDAA
ncbi:MAG TPA: glycosyltransferase family 2 protein [Gemmatimonadales bacterium]|nr:glycosyltransferase family 2 protein [Gemmatimonadales bacterium]